MKKVLWASHFAPYPPKGGALQRSFNLIKQLSEEFDVTLISLVQESKVISFYGDYNVGLRDIRENLAKYCSKVILVEHGGRVNSRGLMKIINSIKSLVLNVPYDVGWLKTKKYSKALQLLKVDEFDLVHIDTVGLYQYFENLDIPKVLNHHNVESSMLFRRSEHSSWLLGLYYKYQGTILGLYEEKAIRSCELNIVCSELDKHRLKKVHMKAVEVVENGVDLEYFTRKESYLSIQPEVVKMIFIGGLGWYPNKKAMIFFAKEIWPRVEKRIPNITMTVIGRGALKILDDLSRSGSKIEHLGFIDDIRKYMEDATIYVCPIYDGGGTKLKMLDAMAMGIPIVAHPVACEGIDVVDGKHVLCATTPDEFYLRIRELVHNAKLRSTLSKNGRNLVEEKYSYDIIGMKLRRFYSELLN